MLLSTTSTIAHARAHKTPARTPTVGATAEASHGQPNHTAPVGASHGEPSEPAGSPSAPAKSDAAGVSATLPPPPGAAVTTATGKLIYLEIDSDLVRPRTHRHPARQVIVYTPEGYDKPENATRHYPVLYLLHGAPGYPTDFIEFGDWPMMSEKASAETGGVAPIMIMPDGNYTGEKHGDSEWANSADGRDRFEDFIVDEIVPFTQKRFRTIESPSGRMIGGVSEGGYGCVNLALHHPDVFGAAIALSGYFDNGGFGWARKVLGYDGEHLRANNPLGYVDTGLPTGEGPRQCPTARFFFGAGVDYKHNTADTLKTADKL